MKNKLLILAAILGGWLITLVGVSFLPAMTAYEANSQTQINFRRLGELGVVSSEFVSRQSGLRRLDVLFKNPGLASQDEVRVNLYRGEGLVATKDFSGFNLGDTSHGRVDLSQSVLKNQKLRLEVVVQKVVDGKLEIGMRDKNIDFIEYYQPSLVVGGMDRLQTTLERVISSPLLWLLPVVCLIGWWW